MKDRGLRVLVDTNVAYTYLSGRDDPYVSEAIGIMGLCSKKEIIGFLAFHSLPTIWYLGRKLSDDERRDMLMKLCNLLTVVGASHNEVIAAILNGDFRDFEDCLQDKCAKEAHCDYIVTANVKDYAFSEIPAVTPDKLIAIWEERQKG